MVIIRQDGRLPCSRSNSCQGDLTCPDGVGESSADLHGEDGRRATAKEHDRDLRCVEAELVAKRRERAAKTADHSTVDGKHQGHRNNRDAARELVGEGR